MWSELQIKLRNDLEKLKTKISKKTEAYFEFAKN